MYLSDRNNNSSSKLLCCFCFSVYAATEQQIIFYCVLLYNNKSRWSKTCGEIPKSCSKQFCCIYMSQKDYFAEPAEARTERKFRIAYSEKNILIERYLLSFWQQFIFVDKLNRCSCHKRSRSARTLSTIWTTLDYVSPQNSFSTPFCEVD